MAQGSVRRFVVGEAQAGTRADVFVANRLPRFTRSGLKRLFEKKLVKADGKMIKASHILKPGEELALDTRPLFASNKPLDLKILYEDKDVLVLHKPAGILTHTKGALNDESTVASFIKKRLTDPKLTGNRAGIVHRLDRPTSGVIITAKTEASQKWLQKQFSTRKTHKTYLAIVEGIPEPQAAIIDAPIARSQSKPQTFKVNANGKPAQTKYKLLQTYNVAGKQYSLLQLEPITGRTHQLRVHLKYVHHPIVGDLIYGSGGPRLMLHAKDLELTLPSGKSMKFSSPIPKKISNF